jgi:hypothetical protein
MLGPVIAAALVGAVTGQLQPGQLQVIPSVTFESRAGEAPLTYGFAPAASFVAVLTPELALDYTGHRLDFRASYDFRLFWRLTSDSSVPAPLYLNTVSLALTGRPTRRTTVRLSASAYEGQADYTYLPNIFGAGQAATVEVPAILAANLSGSAELKATRRVSAVIAVQASHSQPLGNGTVQIKNSNGTISDYTLPHFTSIGATPGVNILLSRLDTLEPSLSFEYQQISNLTITTPGAPQVIGSITDFMITPTLGMRRLLSHYSELTLKLGLGIAHLSGDVTGDRNPVGPLGSAVLDARLLSVRQAVLRAKGSAVVDYYLDPVLGTAATHFTTIGSLYLGLPKSWTVGLEGSFVTSLTAHPFPGTPPTYPDEVGAALDLPVRHLLSDDVMMEFGGRWADRAPFFTAPNWQFHQRQLWLYVLIRGTTLPSWPLQRGVAVPP